VVILFFHEEPTKTQIAGRDKLRSLDLIGTAIFLPSLICLLLALQWGGQKYNWSNVRIIVLFVLFGVGLCVWIYIQYRKQDRATVPPRIIKNRNVFGTMMYSSLIGGAFFVMVYYVCGFCSSRELLLTVWASFLFGSRQSKGPVLLPLA
jgi:hypothetical protein